MKDDEPWMLDDPGKLKALAHPMRRKMLSHLKVRGPATSTTLGELLGAKTGTTSYHLRQLERYGFIEEVPELSGGRERWWRWVSMGDARLPTPGELAPEHRAVLEDFHRAGWEEDRALLERLPAAYRADPAWAWVSRGFARMTEGQLRAFFEDYMALLTRHRSAVGDGLPDARPVYIRLFTIPADDGPDV